MGHVRAALYLDFDNVFSGLYKLDPEAAVRFANDPGAWLRRLSTLATNEPRRWLILRCYLNPSGWVPHPESSAERARLFFSTFRPAFVRAGFDVIDCPRYGGMKNAADIKIVVDTVDALSADTRYDEFLIASGDSDMTPLLQRLRSSDRRTMIVSPTDAADALTAIADQVLDSQQLLALVQGEPVELDDDGDDIVDSEFDRRVANRSTLAPAAAADHREAYEQFRSVVTDAYSQASAAIHMAALAARVRAQQGPSVSDGNWFGFGSFTAAVRSLQLANLRMSQHLLWDEHRHTAPDHETVAPQRPALPEPVDRLADQFNLPRLPQSWWPVLYQTLSDYARSNRFNLTQCTSWSRDELRNKGLPVSRSAVAYVVLGTSFGGSPLHRQPPPTAHEIGAAFTSNVLSRAEDAEMTLSDDEVTSIRTWLNASPTDGQARTRER